MNGNSTVYSLLFNNNIQSVFQNSKTKIYCLVVYIECDRVVQLTNRM